MIPSKLANVIARKGTVYFHSMSTSTTGIWIAGPTYSSCPRTAPATEKGRLAFEALQDSRQRVPHPEDPDQIGRAFLTEQGFKSWSSLLRGARLCVIELIAGKIFIEEMGKSGYSSGFDRAGKRVELLGGTAMDLGEALESNFLTQPPPSTPASQS